MVGTGIVVGLDLAYADETCLELVIGAGLGVGLIMFIRPLTPTLPRNESLLQVLLPLLLPVFVVVAAGLVKWPVLQLIFGVVSVPLAWRFVIVRDESRIQATLEWQWGLVKRLLLLALRIGAAAAVSAVALYAAIRDSAFLEERGLSGAFFIAALLLWLVAALVLRLAAYATSWARATVSLVLLAEFVLLAFWAGLLPGDPEPATVAPLIVMVVVLVAVGVFAHFADAGNPAPTGAMADETADRAAGLGLGSALLASLAMALAAVAGLVDTADRGSNKPAPRLGALTEPGVRPTGAMRPADVALARKYFPVLAFTKDQRWSPIPVEEYLTGTRLTGPDTNLAAPKLAQLPPMEECSSGKRSCFSLTIPGCREGESECAPYSEHGAGIGPFRMGAEYVRVYYLPDAVALAAPFGGSTRRLTKVLQFWLFYRYDRWDRPVLAGRVTQQHQGDWEVVSIGFAAGDAQLFVGYSAHCGGTVEPWGPRARVAVSSSGPTSHPLVAVAEGSQANYPRADQSRSPDLVGCKLGLDQAGELLSYASNVRDKTDYGWLWYPAELIPVDEDTPPMSFPGTWGEDDRTELRMAETRTVESAGAPETPSLQEPWIDPVRAIFCGHYRNRKCPHG